MTDNSHRTGYLARSGSTWYWVKDESAPRTPTLRWEPLRNSRVHTETPYG